MKKNISLNKNGQGSIQISRTGNGKTSIIKKILLKSYNKSFNGYKFALDQYNHYLELVNNNELPPLGPQVGLGDLYINFYMNIYYFKVGDQVFINPQNPYPLLSFSSTIQDLPYVDLGYGLGPYPIIYALNDNSYIKEYLKFYPGIDNIQNHVVECLNDKHIILILGDSGYVYDDVNGLNVGSYFGSLDFGNDCFWAFSFNDPLYGSSFEGIGTADPSFPGVLENIYNYYSFQYYQYLN